MSVPVLSAAAGPNKARIAVLKPESRAGVDLCFNPTEYQLQKGNSYQEIAVPGLQSPPVQYIRGNAEKLTVELLADTSDTLENVRDTYVQPLRALLDIDPALHAPPILQFVWQGPPFVCVLESLQVTYTLFTPAGVPLRAKLSVTLKEFRPPLEQAPPKESPDFTKSYVVRTGDTLATIAAAAYQDPARWRDVAGANAIADPRRLEPGQVLTLPATR
jgi:nucleoid-associated protein YgaU